SLRLDCDKVRASPRRERASNSQLRKLENVPTAETIGYKKIPAIGELVPCHATWTAKSRREGRFRPTRRDLENRAEAATHKDIVRRVHRHASAVVTGGGRGRGRSLSCYFELGARIAD